MTEMRVIPVAGQDSMLLNLSGTHAPFFTRNLVLLNDSADNIGVGEVPGGEKIRRYSRRRGRLSREDDRCVSDGPECRERTIRGEDARRPRTQTFDQRTTIHAVTAIESALLDLSGQFLGLPVCDLLGEGRQRSSVDVLGYLFFIGDRHKCDLPYRGEPNDEDDWFRLRNRGGADDRSVLDSQQAAQARYGFRDFKLKGGVFGGTARWTAVVALTEALSRRANHAGSQWRMVIEEAVHLCSGKQNVLAYAEDPCGAENGFSGREIMAEFRRATGLADGH